MVTKKRNNKKAAMEMTVGTIVTIVLLMSALILGLVLTKTIFSGTTKNVDVLNDQVKSQINSLFSSGKTGVAISLPDNTAKVKPGNILGIAVGYKPYDPRVLGTSGGSSCKYTVASGTSTCSPALTIRSTPPATGFDGFSSVDNTGYMVVKIEVPSTITTTCTARYKVTVTCTGGGSSAADYDSFDVNVVTKG